MFPIMLNAPTDPDREAERERIMAQPPRFLMLTRHPGALVRSLTEFRRKFPDAARSDVALVQLYFDENPEGAVQVMQAR